MHMPNLDVLLVKVPRGTEITPEMAQTFFATLSRVLNYSLLDQMAGRHRPVVSLEVVVYDQRIHFIVVCSPHLTHFVAMQLQSAYPLVVIEPLSDPMPTLLPKLAIGELVLEGAAYYPIKQWKDFRDVDPMSSFLSILSKADKEEVLWLQFALGAAGRKWQRGGQAAMDTGRPSSDGKAARALPEANGIKEKISYPGFCVSVRIGASHEQRLAEIASVFGVFGNPDGNSFRLKLPLFRGTQWQDRLRDRKVSTKKVLNVVEMATLWHLPGEKVKVPSIVWGHAVLSEAPENLPIADGLADQEKSTINFFAKTLFKNSEQIFGITDADRRRHVWCIGKTGTGKSTLIANMAIDDFKKDRGVAIIDPHGDLSEIMMDYIPAHRINDVVYFNPADTERPVVINPLESRKGQERELVVSGIMAIFSKLYGHSWGPRLEYILRNSLLALSELDDATLADVPRLLTDRSFRQRVVERLQDPMMKRYLTDEFEKMPEKLRQEAISPILNKVGQFVSSPMIRRILEKPKSSVDLEEVMNEGKILIANLSQGKIGEDNAALLGAMLITKFQLAAMRRVDLPEEQRRDFYLYVDEFQNFATTSFIKILSEARKYRLNLMMANQYVAQIPIDVQKAILGNAGSIMSFTIGADDAHVIKREFGEVFSENDLVNLDNYQIAIRLMISSQAARPFLATTLPLPVSRNQNREKVIKVSRERYGRG